MTPGILRIPCRDLAITATLTPQGWQCDKPTVERALNQIAPLPATEAGDPLCLAFRKAMRVFHAEVVQEPVPDPWPGIGGNLLAK